MAMTGKGEHRRGKRKKGKEHERRACLGREKEVNLIRGNRGREKEEKQI